VFDSDVVVLQIRYDHDSGDAEGGDNDGVMVVIIMLQ